MAENLICFLVDDDSDDQEIFAMALAEVSPSIELIFADDGILAIEKLTENNGLTPDFIFIDMNMPRINGMQCLEKIRSIDRLKRVPVYLYSTFADPLLVSNIKNIEATDFIIKPPSIDELTNTLSSILRPKMHLYE